jgi:hypothetical protein
MPLDLTTLRNHTAIGGRAGTAQTLADVIERCATLRGRRAIRYIQAGHAPLSAAYPP